MIDYNVIRNLVECEIDKIGKKDQLTENGLAVLYKLVDIRKDLDELEMNDGIADYYDDLAEGNSYRGGRGSNSYRRGYNRGGNSYRGYSRIGRAYNSYDGDMTMEHLHQAMNSASSDSEREAIQNLINKMEHM